MLSENERIMIAEILVGLLATIWLIACSVTDLRTRHVSNRLTLPAIVIALVYRLITGIDYKELIFLVITILLLLLAWGYHLLGGADLKIMLALGLLGAYYVLSAWLGVVVYLLTYLIFRRKFPKCIAGAPGFAIGVLLLTAYEGFITIFFRIGTS